MIDVNLVGIRELHSALTELGDIEGSDELKAGLLAAAGIVAGEARLRANTFSFSAADTIRAGSTGRGASVSGGKAVLPWYGWADFGSRVPRTGQPRSVGPWAKSGKGPRGGRFIYPAIAFKSAEIREAVGDAIDKATERVGFK